MSFKDFTDGVSSIVNALSPLLPVAQAAVGGPTVAAIDTGFKLFQAALALEPEAVALVQRITSGEPVTEAEIHAWEEGYEAAYQGLKASIAAQKAKLHGAARP